MSILVEGKLTGPAGGSINNADIVLTAINTSLVVLGELLSQQKQTTKVTMPLR